MSGENLNKDFYDALVDSYHLIYDEASALWVFLAASRTDLHVLKSTAVVRSLPVARAGSKTLSS